jgi:protein TonB
MKPATLPLIFCTLLGGYASQLCAQTIPARMTNEALMNCRPLYPAMSKRMGEQGTVRMKVHVDLTGEISNPTLTQSSGFQRLDVAAMDMVKCMKFEPGKVDGLPTAMWFDYPVTFKLE